MTGLHLLAELTACGCAAELLCDVQALRRLCLETCAGSGLHAVAEAFHGFGPAASGLGATGVVVLAESHLAIHTWPELRAVTLDIYVCNLRQDNSAAAEAAYARLLAAFQPGAVQRHALARALPSPPAAGLTCDRSR